MTPLKKYEFMPGLNFYGQLVDDDNKLVTVNMVLVEASDVDQRLAALVNSLMAMIEAYEHTIAAEYGYGWEKIADGKHYLQAAKAALAATKETP